MFNEECHLEPIYFSKVQFRSGGLSGDHTIMLLNLVERELSYQVIRKSRNMPVIQGTDILELSEGPVSFDISKAARIIKTPTQRSLLPIENFEDNVVFSYGIKLTEDQYKELLPYCNARKFEPYRNRKMSMSDDGNIGYRDEIDVYFTGVTNSYIPIMEWSMSYYYDEQHIWPSEKLYFYLVTTYFEKNKAVKRWGPSYGEYSFFSDSRDLPPIT